MRARLFWSCFYVLMLFKRPAKLLTINIGVNLVLGGKKRFGESRLLFAMCACNTLLRRLHETLARKVLLRTPKKQKYLIELSCIFQWPSHCSFSSFNNITQTIAKIGVFAFKRKSCIALKYQTDISNCISLEWSINAYKYITTFGYKT